MDKPSSELQLADPRRHRIHKAFNLLKAHASAVATFTLQWQDLEDHIQSVHNSIQAKLDDLQNPNTAAAAAATATTNSNNSKPSNLVNGFPIRDGKKLALHLRERVKDHDSIREGLRDALRASENPGELVLEAIGGFHPPEESKVGGGVVVDSELGAVRKSCVVLLEEFAKVRPEIGAGVREEAIRVATEWKKKMNVEMVNSLEVLGFLTLLSAFGLVGEFDRDEVLSLIGNVIQRKQALDLFRSLGLSDKASDFIQNLISQKKRIEAVRFIHAFELVDKFPLVPLLQDQVNDAKKVAKNFWKNGKSSAKEKDNATNKEIAALRSVVRCIEEYKLESDFSPEDLKKRIELLRNQKEERKAKEKIAKLKAPAPNTQAKQLSGNKRTFSDSKGQLKNPQNKNKHSRTEPPIATAPNISARAPVAVHSMHHRPIALLEGEGMRYLIPSAVMAMPSAASPNAPARATVAHTMHHWPVGLLEGECTEYLRASAAAAANTSNLYSTEASHHLPSASLTGQRGEYSPVYYNLARSTLDAHTSIPLGSHGLADSPTQRTSLASRAYGLTGSIPETQRSSMAHYGLAASNGVTERFNSLSEQCGTSAAASGRTGQFGPTRALQLSGIPSNASPHSPLTYYPEDPLRVAGLSERPLSTNSNYELLSNRSHVFHL